MDKNGYTTNNNIVSEKLTSNLQFIRDHISNISNKTNDYINFCNDKHTVNSVNAENKLYLGLNNIMNSYYSAQIVLMQKLNKEFNFIVKVGESFDRLDNELATKIGDL